MVRVCYRMQIDAGLSPNNENSTVGLVQYPDLILGLAMSVNNTVKKIGLARVRLAFKRLDERKGTLEDLYIWFQVHSSAKLPSLPRNSHSKTQIAHSSFVRGQIQGFRGGLQMLKRIHQYKNRKFCSQT